MDMNSQMEELRTCINLMSRKIQEIFDQTIRALESRNESDAKKILVADDEIDNLEVDTDRRCMYLLALKEPYAHDFRYIYSAIKTAGDLERIGDECKTIAKWSLKLNSALDPKIKELSSASAKCLEAGVNALIHFDLNEAKRCLELEYEVDAIEDMIINKPGVTVPEAFIAKALERISDLSTNISENIIFSEKAIDIRHGQYQK